MALVTSCPSHHLVYIAPSHWRHLLYQRLSCQPHCSGLKTTIAAHCHAAAPEHSAVHGGKLFVFLSFLTRPTDWPFMHRLFFSKHSIFFDAANRIEISSIFTRPLCRPPPACPSPARLLLHLFVSTQVIATPKNFGAPAEEEKQQQNSN